jgi:diguanylate cyclase (GGDEF)-like protein
MLGLNLPPINAHAVLGVAGTLTALAAIELTNRFLIEVPTPAAIALLFVIASSYFGGLISGCVSAAACALYALWLYTGTALSSATSRLVLVFIVAPFVAVLPAVLVERWNRALWRAERENRHLISENMTLAQLHAALDEVNYGVALLDVNLNACFLNRRFNEMWNIPPEVAADSPSIANLLKYGGETRAAGIVDEVAYVDFRVELIRRGDDAPIDISLRDSRVIRFHCAQLPDGGRMLTYTDITDLKRHAEELQHLATTDGLSGVLNRRSFLELADREFARATLYRQSLSLLMIDIDHFKTINDTFGHAVGDEVIAEIAARLRGNEEGVAIAGRVGGEEFAILLPEMDSLDAARTADSLRKRVASEPIGNVGIRATVSIGVATTSAETSSLGSVLAAADHALYEAKARGRNRVRVARRTEAKLSVVHSA